MKKVIYTCLVGNYDSLKQPLAINESYDYICFSNDINTENIGIWKIKKIPFQSNDSTRLSRYVKILPHKALPEYDFSVWMDANLQIATSEFYEFIESAYTSHSLISQVPHIDPPIDCIYDEIRYAYRLVRVGFVEAKRQYNHLKENNFPKHYGLFENNIITRFHNDALVKKISEEWWSEYISYTRRDQFSLMFIYWKNNFFPFYLFGENRNTKNIDCIKYSPHIRILSELTLTTIFKSLRKNSVKYIKKIIACILVHFIK